MPSARRPFPPAARFIAGLLALAVCGLLPACKPSIEKNGGLVISVKIKEDPAQPLPPDAAHQTAAVLAKRIRAAGIKGASLVAEDAGQVSIRIPNTSPGVPQMPAESLRGLITEMAQLELREVHRDTDENGTDGKTLAQRVLDQTQIVPGYQAFTYKTRNEDGKELLSAILLRRQVALSGRDIVRAIPSPNRSDAVDVTLGEEGTEKMIALTKAMQRGRDRIAIVLDGVVTSAPVLMQTPLGKDFQVTGLDQPGEPQHLANSLMCPLEHALTIVAESTVSPTK